MTPRQRCQPADADKCARRVSDITEGVVIAAAAAAGVPLSCTSKAITEARLGLSAVC